MPPIIDCSEELAPHICDPCPTATKREFGRLRTSGFIFKSYLPTLLLSPTTPLTWTTGIASGKIIVVPETSGSYDPGDRKVLKGYGDRPENYGPYTSTVSFNDPNLADNYAHYNGLGNQTELVPFFVTSTKLRIFDTAASITAKDPVADDIESEVVWQVTAKVISDNLPRYFDATPLKNTVFTCSALNNIPSTITYDTLLEFSGNVTDAAADVSATVPTIDADAKVEFNAIVGVTGTSQTMNVDVAGVESFQIVFLSGYLGHSVKITDAAGTAHVTTFQSGDVSF